jgi:Na+-transporting NADH:ubiquinone oxidoreductase subunit E
MMTLFLEAVFVENLALAFFLGICTLLGGSRRLSTAVGLGIAITVVMTITLPINHLIHRFLLAPGAWAWAGMAELDLSHLSLICFIGSIAAMVQILEMVLDRFFPALARGLGIFLPLITVNCAILGGSLFMVDRHYDLGQTVVYAVGSGVGWALAVAALAAIRERVDGEHLPEGSASDSASQALVFAVIGIMSTAYMAFSGVRLP